MNGGLHSISIAPAFNGGFTVTHRFMPKASYSRGLGGGFGMNSQPDQQHSFGPGQHGQLVAHLVKALGLGEARAEEAEVKGKYGRSPGLRAARIAQREVSGQE